MAFLANVLDKIINFKSDDECLLYSSESMDERKDVDSITGWRVGLRKINRTSESNLLPAMDLIKTVYCVAHAVSRCTEKLVELFTKFLYQNHQQTKASKWQEDLTRLEQNVTS